MSLLFSKSALAVNSANEYNFNQQWAEVQQRRRYANAVEDHLAQLAGNSSQRVPADVYREFDRTITRVFRDDEGEQLLADLMPYSRNINVGKIEYEFARATDSGNAQTTLSGQTTISMDKADYTYDKTIVPIHQDSFGRQWRELEGQRSEGFDGLIDDQANAVRSVRRQLVSWILDGDSSLVFNGTSWTGIRNDTTRVQPVDLGAGGLNIDLTSSAATGANIRAAFKSMTDTLRITNKVNADITFHVSRAIYSNMDRPYDDNEAGWRTILDMVKGIAGVADVKETAAFTGNELSGMALSEQYVRPLVGMAVNTIAVPRTKPFEAHNFITWAAVGFQAVTDAADRKAVLYAS